MLEDIEDVAQTKPSDGKMWFRGLALLTLFKFTLFVCKAVSQYCLIFFLLHHKSFVTRVALKCCVSFEVQSNSEYCAAKS